MEYKSYYNLEKEAFGEYIIFADESGDHGLNLINPENPVFTLALCMFKKTDYIIAKQAITSFKLKFWGHDLAILHRHDIQKAKGEFSFLFDEKKREFFLSSLSETMRTISFSIVATSINKLHLIDQVKDAGDLYFLALSFCIFSLYDFLKENNQRNHITHIIFESRGNAEDKALEAAFRKSSIPCKLDIKFADKKMNSIGLQIADLVVHPISRHVIKPDQPNQAFDIVKTKLFGFPEYNEIGLKVFPPTLQKTKGPSKS